MLFISHNLFPFCVAPSRATELQGVETSFLLEKRFSYSVFVFPCSRPSSLNLQLSPQTELLYPPKRLWGAGCGTGPPLHLPPGTCTGRLMPVEARGSPVSNLKPRARATRPSPSCQEQPGLRGGGQGAVSPRGPQRRCSDRLHNHRKVCPQPASCWLPRGSPRIPRPGTRGPARCLGRFPRGGPWRHRAHRANPHEPAKSQRNG